MHAFPALSIICASLISSALSLLAVQACRPLAAADRPRPGQVVARPCRLPMAAEAILPRVLVAARPRLALVVVRPRRVLVAARPHLAPVAALPRHP